MPFVVECAQGTNVVVSASGMKALITLVTKMNFLAIKADIIPVLQGKSKCVDVATRTASLQVIMAALPILDQVIYY